MVPVRHQRAIGLPRRVAVDPAVDDAAGLRETGGQHPHLVEQRIGLHLDDELRHFVPDRAGAHQADVDEDGIAGVVAQVRVRRDAARHVEADPVVREVGEVEDAAVGEVVLREVDLACGDGGAFEREDPQGDVVEVGSGGAVDAFR